MLDMDTRLRVARGIAKTETEDSQEVYQTLKTCGHPDAPPPTMSAGVKHRVGYLISVKSKDEIENTGEGLWCMNIFSPTSMGKSFQELRLRPTAD